MAREGQAVIAALRALTVEEARAVRQGAFALLPELGVRKAALVERLRQVTDTGDAQDLSRLRAASEINGRLLQAALRGIGAAQARLAAIRQAGMRLNTYDNRGRAQSVSFAAGQVERRA